MLYNGKHSEHIDINKPSWLANWVGNSISLQLQTHSEIAFGGRHWGKKQLWQLEKKGSPLLSTLGKKLKTLEKKLKNLYFEPFCSWNLLFVQHLQGLGT